MNDMPGISLSKIVAIFRGENEMDGECVAEQKNETEWKRLKK